jgi:glycerol-3-phosphate dehydrogenase (NAD(P)+)
VGLELARGRSLAAILGEMRMVAEGVNTTRAAVRLAERHEVEVPIAGEVHAILKEGKSPDRAVEDLMLRRLKPEHWGVRDA